MKPKQLKLFLQAHYPLIGVLIGSFLIANSMGIYSNWDAQIEYEAASTTATGGFPYLSTGLMINQPPLGFYAAAAALQLYGASYQNGVALTTLFGVASVALVYAFGALLYGRRTGLVASALFGLIPWHVYLSRTFLIDNQYLFWSLLFLVVGVLAVRRNSDKLAAVAGAVFAVALLSKLFSVFALIPLALIVYFAYKEGTFQRPSRKLLLFILPILISQAVWYGVFANQNFSAVYFSTDFSHTVNISNPSLLFLPTNWAKSSGLFLFAAVAFSLAFAFVYRRKIKALWRVDLTLLASIAAIAAVDLVLVLGFHLTVPYVSVTKYTYMALPFLCLIAASVADKSPTLLPDFAWKTAKAEWAKIFLAAVGLMLVFASLLESLHHLGGWVDYGWFAVDSETYYPFNLYAQTAYRPVLYALQQGALALIVLSMFLPVLMGKMHKALIQLWIILSN